jgi:hypothetical protein
MEYRTLLEQRRKRLEKAASALDLLSDPDIQAQLAADPEMRAAFLNAVGGSNGSDSQITEPSGGVASGTGKDMPPPGSQLRAILDAAAKVSDHFTTKELVEKMTSAGYKFAASEPQIAINSALKQLQARGFLRLVKQGRGRAASIFQYVGEG